MWKNDTRALVRSLIYDISEPYTYPDSDLNTLILHAAKILCNEVNFQYNISLSTGQADPSPDDDSDFIVLCSYKTVCMIAAAEVKTYALDNGISVKDGPSSIDFSNAGSAAQKRYQDFCEQYEEKRMQYLTGNSPGKIISGPIVNENCHYYKGNM